MCRWRFLRMVYRKACFAYRLVLLLAQVRRAKLLEEVIPLPNVP